MQRISRRGGFCSVLWLAVLAACYAVPERHSVTREGAEGGAGRDGGGSELDADALDSDVEDDAGDGGRKDAAPNGCRCSDPQRPICIEATKTCVACTADAGSCAANQLCDVLRGECVECLQNTDCKDPKASVCDPATYQCQACADTNDTDCSHIDGKNVCLAGACVQCSKDKLAACVVQQSPTTSVQNACHALEHTCSEYEAGKTDPCGECVSDAQCTDGHRCLQMPFGGPELADKWYCQPLLQALNCNNERPYVALATSAVTIEGEVADVCTLSMSTCSAHNHFRKYCGLDQDNRPIPLGDAGVPVAPSVKGDNTLCGLPGLEDGYCIEVQPGLHRCSVACADVQDCPHNAPACSDQAHATGRADICTMR